MRYTLRDDTLPHQIRLFLHRGRIAVSCNCLATGTPNAGGPSYKPLRARTLLPAEEALEIYREHLADIERSAS